MRAILISNKYPFPTDDGKKTVLAGFASYLLRKYGEDDFVYVVVGKKTDSVDESRSGRTVFIDPPSRFAQLRSLATVIFGRNAKSLQEALTWSSDTREKLHALVRKIGPELLVLDTIRIGQYFHARPGEESSRCILYMDDLFYMRFERLLSVASRERGVEIDPVGTFAPHLPSLARVLLRSSLVQKNLFRFEMSRVRRRELASPNRFDRCLLINPNEVQELARQSGAKNLCAVKPVLPNDEVRHERTYDGSAEFLIFGSLRHPVYRASVIRFIDTCMEDIVRLVPNAKIRIVGAGADDTMRQRVDRFADNLELSGFVEDLDALFTTSCALLVPMLTAGGLKLKALTALYYGTPLISTGDGVDGITVRHGHDCIVENRLDRFPEHMKALCDVRRNREIAANARQTYLKYYSRERVFAEYDELFS